VTLVVVTHDQRIGDLGRTRITLRDGRVDEVLS
ncbi:MAG TPA: ABC transporter ATP-binding protein, partial [Spirochaetaceae bacterium]|nr:ABC transporter ATP-binding protein [Spirochaetaceae bacterium]